MNQTRPSLTSALGEKWEKVRNQRATAMMATLRKCKPPPGHGGVPSISIKFDYGKVGSE